MTQAIAPNPGAPTHEVLNQPPALEPYNAFESDAALGELLEREGGGWGRAALSEYGRAVGHELLEAGFAANRCKPELRTHDRFGHRIDVVDYHPAYHELMAAAIGAGWHSAPWTDPRPGANVVRAAFEYLHHQADSGTGCPLTMTFASVATIRHEHALAEIWMPRITAREYDRSDRPWSDKPGVTIGMAMTEKQGGTDLRTNTTQARPIDGPGPTQAYAITGHKWFCSAPMCDGFLMLARSEGGLSCFLMPRWRAQGERNAIHVQRLKDKLGNHSNASGEVEFRDALAWMVGPEGRGIPTIIEMVALTRFDCMVGSSALMRQALAQAIHHCAYREVLGRPLARQPLMQNVLADLALESEAALAMSLRLARRMDEAAYDERARRFVRIATAVGKYWICKRAPAHVNEAAECLGGAGYVEESILPRLYREAPVNSTWEGSGNVQCLDVLRAMKVEAGSLDAFFEELGSARDAHSGYERWLERLEDRLADPDALEYGARALVEDMALALEAAVLIDAGNELVADAFCATRLDSRRSLGYGSLPPGVPVEALIERARPRV